MTFNSKRIIVTILAGIAILIVYLIYALGEKAPDVTDIKAWAIMMLIFIGIAIVASIIINILFHIFYSIGIAIKERDKSDEEVERIIESTVLEDERDKQISLKSSLVGYACVGIGFISSLIFLAIGQSTVMGLNIVLASFFVGSFIEGLVSIYQYERGV